MPALHARCCLVASCPRGRLSKLQRLVPSAGAAKQCKEPKELWQEVVGKLEVRGGTWVW